MSPTIITLFFTMFKKTTKEQQKTAGDERAGMYLSYSDYRVQVDGK